MIANFSATGLRGTNMMRWMLASMLVLGVLSLNAGRGTLAYFTTQVTSTGNTFTAGNLKLNIQDVDETGAGQTTVASSLTLSNMKPGDAVVAPIKLTKAGSIDTKYGIAYTTATAQPTDTNLANILHIQVLGTGTTGTGTNTATGANACNATNFAAPGTIWPDAVVADTALAAAGATLLSVSPTSGVGRNIPTSGANTGFEVLCVKVSWPDGGAPPSLTTGDNQYNLATAGVVNTTLSFAFDGLAQP